MRKKTVLRIGVMIDEGSLPRWVVRILESIEASDYAELVLVVCNQRDNSLSTRSSNSLKWKIDHLLYLLYRKIDSKLSLTSGSPFASTGLPESLSVKNTLKVTPNKTKFCDRLKDSDVQCIQEQKLDVILRFGFRILKGEVLNASKHGVWSFHHGDSSVNHGGPSGFWEVMNGEPLSGVTLQVLSEELDAGMVLQRELCKTDTLLVDRSRANMYWQSVGMVMSKLHQLSTQGDEAFYKTQRSKYPKQFFYSSPLYTAPKNLQLFQLAVAHAGRYLRKKISFLLYKRQWALFYQFSTKRDITKSIWRFKELKSPKDRFWADPFVVCKDNRYFVFFEELIFSQNKGCLAVLELNKDGTHGKPVKILEQDTHLSWPFVFEFEGNWYMVPESSKDKRISLYSCSHFPEQWEFSKVLLDETEAVDPTIVFHDNQWWLFAVVKDTIEGNLQDNLFLWYSDNPVEGEWKPHVLNPVVSDVSSARSAGRLFSRDGILYRPSQNCSEGYGRSIKINRVDLINTWDYRETCVEEVKPNWRGDIIATHSLSFDGDLTMIDAQKSRFLR